MRKISSSALMLLLMGVLPLAVSVEAAFAFTIRPIYETFVVYVVFWNGEEYRVVIESTSQVSDVYFHQPRREFGFSVEGPDGTYGLTNVIIPREVLWVDSSFEWRVLFDDRKLSPVIYFNGTHTKFFLNYFHSTHKIRILGSHAIGPEEERKVGVKVGDWVKYDMVFNYTSNDPYPPTPPPTPGSEDLQYFKMVVHEIAGTNVTLQMTVHYKNGTEESYASWIDVSFGYGFFLIGANLTAGDRIYQTPYSLLINATLMRKYAGAEREVNYVGLRQNLTAYPGYMLVQKMEMYWDRATGVLDEIAMRQKYVDVADGYVTQVYMHVVITETSIWHVQKTHLGSGWGWMRIDHRKAYGEANLYKIEEKQIELTIKTRDGEYSKTWNITRHKTHKNHELIFCKSKENGALTILLYKGRVRFWQAIGRDAVAFGTSVQMGRRRHLLPK